MAINRDSGSWWQRLGRFFSCPSRKALYQESSDQFWFRNINYHQAANMMQINKDAERARAPSVRYGAGQTA